MKDVKMRCEKCGLPLQWRNLCDNCGKEIPPDEIFHTYLTVSRTNPESDETFTFDFCNYRCMVKWMKKRKAVVYKDSDGTTPYMWEKEARDKFGEKKRGE